MFSEALPRLMIAEVLSISDRECLQQLLTTGNEFIFVETLIIFFYFDEQWLQSFECLRRNTIDLNRSF